MQMPYNTCYTWFIAGNFSLRALGTPLIFKSLYDATKKVPNPNRTEVNLGRTTVYDTWKATFLGINITGQSMPFIFALFQSHVL